MAIRLSNGFYARYGKRLLDFSLSAIGLLLLWPLFLIVAIAIRVTSPGPAFFRQVRTGQYEKPFRIFKFRTMRTVAPKTNGQPLITVSGDPRITPIGHFLRKTKIDELPQLINVFLGQMSFVGPRPEVTYYMERCDARQRMIYQVKPGITGPATGLDDEVMVSSHPDREFFFLHSVVPARMEVNLIYCQNICFLDDVRLIFDTVAKVFHRGFQVSRASLTTRTS